MTPKRKRGFASMDPELQRRIARLGGAASHEQGRAHEWDSGQARNAGRRGGRAAHERGTAHQWSADEAKAAGRRGGQSAHRRGTAHEWDPNQAREAGKRGGQARWARYYSAASKGLSQADTRASSAGVTPGARRARK